MLDNSLYCIITIFLILYSSYLSPTLPKCIQNLFNNTIFKIIILFLLIYFKNDIPPSIALLIVISYVLTLEYIYFINSKETFSITTEFNKNNNIEFINNLIYNK